ncbi:10259_t:CDS:2, partial [Racocetra fulgida]
MAAQISKKRKLNEFFTRELAEEGYSGVEVRVTPARTEIIIRATHTQEVLGEKGRRIRELTALIQKRFKFPENTVELYAEKVQNRGLCAIAQCESLRYKLLAGLAGCEVVVSGKLRAARAKSMKFVDGFMIHSGQPIRDYVDTAVRHVMLRQGVLGIKDWDPTGKIGPKKSLPDVVNIMEPKEEPLITQPTSEDFQRPPQDIPATTTSPIPQQDIKMIMVGTKLRIEAKDTDISNNLHGAVTKAIVQKVLTSLVDKEEVVCKTYGKQSVYVVSQEQFESPSPDELNNMDAEIEDLKKEVNDYKERNKQLQSGDHNNRNEERLQELKSGTKSVSVEDKN